MDHLAGGMDAGIGTTGAGNGDAFIGHYRQRIFQYLLHGTGTVTLHLPATEFTTIVLNTQCYTHASTRIFACNNKETPEPVRGFLSSIDVPILLTCLLQQLFSLLLLFVVTFGLDLFQDAPGAFVIAHINIGFGQIKLGADFVNVVG